MAPLQAATEAEDEADPEGADEGEAHADGDGHGAISPATPSSCQIVIPQVAEKRLQRVQDDADCLAAEDASPKADVQSGAGVRRRHYAAAAVLLLIHVHVVRVRSILVSYSIS